MDVLSDATLGCLGEDTEIELESIYHNFSKIQCKHEDSSRA